MYLVSDNFPEPEHVEHERVVLCVPVASHVSQPCPQTAYNVTSASTLNVAPELYVLPSLAQYHPMKTLPSREGVLVVKFV